MEPQRLADQLRRSYEGDAWHGPALGELLSEVSAEKAARKPLSGAHSVWELVLHLEAWEREVLLVLQGKPYESMIGDKDWPPVTTFTAEAWKNARERLRLGALTLAEAAGAIDDAKLNETVAGRDFTYYVMLHGVVQHNLYHAGQISLLLRHA